MSNAFLLSFLMGSFVSTIASAIPDFSSGEWNGKRAAVALTYDDSLNVHLDNVQPELAKHDFKATFYVTVGHAPFPERLEEWRQLAAEGHELGNHTSLHPCEGGRPGREWVEPEKDLSQWSLKRMVDDITLANITLRALDGREERTFAYPCGDMNAGGEAYQALIREDFVGARGVQTGLQTIKKINPFDINAHMINGESAAQLKRLVDKAIERGALVVFLFHGVGGEHPLDVSEENHAALLDYIKQKQDQLWVAPMVDIAAFVRTKQSNRNMSAQRR